MTTKQPISKSPLKPSEKEEFRETVEGSEECHKTSKVPKNALVEAGHQVLSVVLLVYTLWSLFGMVAWISHLGARVKFLEPFLPGGGYARNKPVENVYELLYYNMPSTLGFTLPHSFLRPPRMFKLVGQRYARLLYCAMAGATCHLLLATFRPINMTAIFSGDDYVYDEAANLPLFTLPVPKVLHDLLSISMLLYSFYAVTQKSETFIILGFNRAFYGPDSGKDKFPKGLSPRMDIITWMGYAVWLEAGNLGFILFSGLSILPYKVYTWDIVLRVVAASYLRLRSQGFRVWVGRIEKTHHLIWVLRGLIVAAAMGYQYHLLSKNQDSADVQMINADMFNVKTVVIMCVSGLAIALLLDRLEKIR